MVALLGLLGLPGAAVALTGGPITPVNTTTDGYQRAPVIAADPAGGFTVAWQSWTDVPDWDGSAAKYDIFARRFDASGAPVSGEIPVNTTTPGPQEEPTIAGDGAGGFVVAWVDNQLDGSGIEGKVFARHFGPSGEPLGGEILVSAIQTGFQFGPAIAHDPGGGFTVTWVSNQEGGASRFRIFVRRFDFSGNPVGAQITANTPGPTKLDSPDVAPTVNGSFVVTWVGRDFQETRSVVYMRRFDAAGKPNCRERELEELQGKPGTAGCPEVPVNPSFAPRQNGPAIVALDGGRFAIAWMGEAGDGVFVRPFDSSGEPERTPVRVDPPGHESAANPALAADPDGGFSVAWRGSEGSGSPERIFVRRYNEDGAELTTAVPVDPSPGLLDQPVIAADGSGGFTVSWVRHLDLGQGGQDVFARHFVRVPETFIDAGPEPLTNAVDQLFRFSTDEPWSEAHGFECSLDGAQFATCQSPRRITSLSDGPHTFEARSMNEIGETDQSPASTTFTVDSVGPDGEIESGPSGLIDDSTPSFTFSSDDPEATFECQLDVEPFAPCVSPVALGPLIDGPHTFTARSRDEAGNFDLTLAVRDFTVDTHPPTVAIVSGPEAGTAINDATPSFGFDADEPATFVCKVDGGPAEACGTPFTSAALTDGPHVFMVTGTDIVGHSGSVSREFTIDATAPDTEIASGPSGPISNRTPTFTFSSEEADATFECRVDGDAFQPCGSPDTTHILADGPHVFSVRAADQLGNTDSTPATRAFTVDTVAPETTIESGPPRLTRNATPGFGFASSEPGFRFECRLDSGGFSPCAVPFIAPRLSDDFHSFEVRAIDQAANVDPSPASEGFAVDTNPPSVKVRAAKGEVLGRPIMIHLSCAEACEVTARGKVAVAHGTTLRLRAVTRQLEERQPATLSLKTRGSKAPGGARGRAVLSFEFRDRAGNERSARLRVPLAGA